jgi:hypothetical protein
VEISGHCLKYKFTVKVFRSYHPWAELFKEGKEIETFSECLQLES